MYSKNWVLLFFDDKKMINVKTANTKNIRFIIFRYLNSLIQIAHRGFRIKNIKPMPEAIP